MSAAFSLRLHVLGAVSCALAVSVFGQEQSGEAVPDRYRLAYPTADRCCPPIRSTFFEAERTFSVVRGKRFTHKPNGGFGLPVVDKVDGKHLLHLGADLGWHQVGEPVFAIANGVVRVSTGPRFVADDQRPSSDERPASPAPRSGDNVVVIEHRFGDDEYFTTMYLHLATNRLVKAGDVVRAGQQIGEIGRQHARINGGYTPHVHFAVREGRIAEIGATLVKVTVAGRPAAITLAGLGEEWIEVSLPEGMTPPLRLRQGDEEFSIESRDGKAVVPARLLWKLQPADFALVGYALSTDGWRDPIQFLREHRADTQPAPFQRAAKRKVR